MSHYTAFSDKPPLNHVAVIMDGNGRWAKQRGLSRLEGHKKGAEAIQKLLNAAKDASVNYITLFAFSTENWNRPKEEITGLMQLLNVFLFKYAKRVVRDKIRFRVIGDYTAFPEKVVNRLDKLMQDTRAFSEKNLTLALNYSSRAEIVASVKRYVAAASEGIEDPASLDWEKLSGFLDTKDIPDPDLIIRTSGEHRLSNFLLLQGAYAEIYVTQTYWPDFNEAAFQQALDSYYARERRFGKTGDQIQQLSSPIS